MFTRNNTHTHENARARIIETGAIGTAPAGCLCQPNACSRLLTLKCFANVYKLCTKMPFLLFVLYKIKVFERFLIKNLHISKKSSTFAVKLKH